MFLEAARESQTLLYVGMIDSFRGSDERMGSFRTFSHVILGVLWGVLLLLSPYALLAGTFGLLTCLLLAGRSLYALWVFWGGVGLTVAFVRGEASSLHILVGAFSLWILWLSERSLLSSELREASRIVFSPYLRRKLSRFLFLLLPLGVYPVLGQQIFRYILFFLGGLALGFELLRSMIPELKRMSRPFFRASGRAEEAETLSGVTLFLVGSAVTALFPGRAGPLGVTLLIVGDGWASLVGQRWGTYFWRRGKSLVGSLACVLASAMGALLLFPDLSFSPCRLVAISLLSGVAEGAFRGVWDNLFMGPLVALAFCLLM